MYSKKDMACNTQYITWFSKFMNERKFCSFINYKYVISENRKYIYGDSGIDEDIINDFYSLIKEYAIKHRIKTKPSNYFSRPYRVEYTGVDEKGNLVTCKFVIYEDSEWRVSAHIADENDKEEFISFNKVMEEYQNEYNQKVKTLKITQ